MLIDRETPSKELDKALLEQTWDPSVKSLCALPDVLNRMNENLDWTQDLGDAVLGQKTELMDTVQRMRGKAYDAGNLKTTEQQVVVQQPDKIIVVESASPEVIYVPTYSPTVVYGSSWYYPTWYYPPMYYPPPPGYGLVSFGVGMAVGAAIWGNSNWGWGHGDIDIDVNRYNEFNRNTSMNSDRTRVNGGQGGKGNWQHDASHRKGVNYRDQKTAGKYGARAGSTRVSRDQARGRSQTGASTRDARGNLSGSSRPSAGQMDRAAGSADRSRTAGSSSRASGYDRGSRSSSTASRGSRSPSMDRAASSRGSMSRGTRSYGGGGRAGGGGRRR